MAVLLGPSAGCKLLSPNADSLSEEAAARRAIDGDGIFRPEGRAAEKRSKPQALFDKMVGRDKYDVPKARALYLEGDKYFNDAASWRAKRDWMPSARRLRNTKMLPTTGDRRRSSKMRC